ncbi:cyclic nucleotide-binding domain-containing protein [Raineya orbicola]|jgi:signal-transduction protein with cAMP-binding, CBS, and nucleotidyltransferase domain|uniref:Cyclic nucleotide-binding domain n=1 Tax=Raineya orbicola TaxID=2016530 RepID=A0A2N3IKT3_9BACT|nr:cyclic nucleotide-binding domain-containing protein [Raineya orbicola]PKQ70927.1 Cyclic nucleotide-binding domain [Raineya orbicola]
MKLLNPFRKVYSTQEKEIFDFFKNVKLFERLTEKEMEEFLPFLHLREYKQNEAIFFRNDPSQALYVIKSGTVELNLDHQDSFETLATAKKGVAIGINALVENSERVYNAVVRSKEALLYIIPQVNILEIFKYKISIQAKMMTSLAELYDENTKNLFNSYRRHIGLFHLGEAYMKTFQSE